MHFRYTGWPFGGHSVSANDDDGYHEKNVLNSIIDPQMKYFREYKLSFRVMLSDYGSHCPSVLGIEPLKFD